MLLHDAYYGCWVFLRIYPSSQLSEIYDENPVLLCNKAWMACLPSSRESPALMLSICIYAESRATGIHLKCLLIHIHSSSDLLVTESCSIVRSCQTGELSWTLMMHYLCFNICCGIPCIHYLLCGSEPISLSLSWFQSLVCMHCVCKQSITCPPHQLPVMHS